VSRAHAGRQQQHPPPGCAPLRACLGDEIAVRRGSRPSVRTGRMGGHHCTARPDRCGWDHGTLAHSCVFGRPTAATTGSIALMVLSRSVRSRSFYLFPSFASSRRRCNVALHRARLSVGWRCCCWAGGGSWRGNTADRRDGPSRVHPDGWMDGCPAKSWISHAWSLSLDRECK
jgi:hypothetical protein